MNINKIKIIINKSVEDVFEFTTNPQNTPLWIYSIKEEIAEKYPPKIGTKYKNRGKDYIWDFYKVFDFKKNEKFSLEDLKENYKVVYTYKKLGDNKTEMEYLEWMENGELKQPFSKDVLLKLKSVIENNS